MYDYNRLNKITDQHLSVLDDWYKIHGEKAPLKKTRRCLTKITNPRLLEIKYLLYDNDDRQTEVYKIMRGGSKIGHHN